MTVLNTIGSAWSSISAPVVLSFPFSYVPLVCRTLAILIAAPFLFSIALELIAYVIARTLHISIERLRVPRSPPPANPRDLAEREDDDDPVAASLEGERPTPFSTAFGQAVANRSSARVIVGTSLIFGFIALAVQVLSLQSTGSLDALVTGPNPVALVLTAHPDDEAMFFAPTILNLIAAGWGVVAVCMSNGNAAGLGYTRALELASSYARLGVPKSNLTLFDHPELLDGWPSWDAGLIAELVKPAVKDHAVTHMVTFDSQGITQHPNHVVLAKVPGLLGIRSLELQSPSILAKFTGPLYALYAGLTRSDNPKEVTIIASPSQYLEALRAMQCHWSQLVWFRWLYVSFSHLMWVNELIEA